MNARFMVAQYVTFRPKVARVLSLIPVFRSTDARILVTNGFNGRLITETIGTSSVLSSEDTSDLGEAQLLSAVGLFAIAYDSSVIVGRTFSKFLLSVGFETTLSD